ncbi:hypothetical protein niasHS_003563 [Heterodera schachtii]|uniref:NF-kappa-B inhibitor-interacting Ras-like protein 1 n=1 Tax=Heterodera schachtii TaxID=97005 RepID=A0ABD2KHB7_HETSC
MHVVVLGPKKVGKTSLLKSLINQHDPKPSTSSSDGQLYVPTVEDTFHVQFGDFRSVDQMPQRSLLILFHDTAGITDFGSIELRKPYLQVADAFLLVYSVLDPLALSQMEALKKYLEREKNGTSKERKEVPIAVVGTNCEMAGKKVNTESALLWASREKVKLFEVSANDRKSVAEIAQHLSERFIHSLKDSKFSLSRKLKPEKSNAQIVMDF